MARTSTQRRAATLLARLNEVKLKKQIKDAQTTPVQKLKHQIRVSSVQRKSASRHEKSKEFRKTRTAPPPQSKWTYDERIEGQEKELASMLAPGTTAREHELAKIEKMGESAAKVAAAKNPPKPINPRDIAEGRHTDALTDYLLKNRALPPTHQTQQEIDDADLENQIKKMRLENYKGNRLDFVIAQTREKVQTIMDDERQLRLKLLDYDKYPEFEEGKRKAFLDGANRLSNSVKYWESELERLLQEQRDTEGMPAPEPAGTQPYHGETMTRVLLDSQNRMESGGQSAREPTPDQIEQLRRDPSPQMIEWYDQAFGRGAAQKALGSNGMNVGGAVRRFRDLKP